MWYGKGRKHCWKRKKNAGNQHFLLFPQCSKKATFLRLLKVGIVCKRVNPFRNKPWFLRVCCASLLKTLREKEKLLVELSAIFIKFKIVVCQCFEFGRVKKKLFGKGLKDLKQKKKSEKKRKWG